MRRYVLLLLALALGCSTNWRAEFHPPAEAASLDDADEAPAPAVAVYLKVHTNDGEVYVLDSWRFDEAAGTIHGQGLHYSLARVLFSRGEQLIPYDSVALLETNTPERVTHATSLAIMGVVSAAIPVVGIACLANPKACYGSCPTFYVYEGEALELRAEGFSSAIARALEIRDVDHLGVVDPAAGHFDVVMANEALETHFVRGVELLSVARPAPDVDVFHTRTGFVGVRARQAASACQGLAGDCVDALRSADGREYSSTTDGENLAARELIELEFPAQPQATELVVLLRVRNTLLDTFLFYQALSYLGAEAPRWFLREGSDGSWSVLRDSFKNALGDIEVELWDGQQWLPAGSVRELGPIAWETQAVVLPKLARAAGQNIRMRLRLTRGRWKLDEASLGEFVGELPATRLQPIALAREGERDDVGLAKLRDPDRHLLSYPGEVWTLSYELPAGSQTLFLAAEGYYLEWMRDEWIAEQDLVEAARFFLTPEATLRRLAPIYKAVEGQLEPVFWQTRIRPKSLHGATLPEGEP